MYHKWPDIASIRSASSSTNHCNITNVLTINSLTKDEEGQRSRLRGGCRSISPSNASQPHSGPTLREHPCQPSVSPDEVADLAGEPQKTRYRHQQSRHPFQNGIQSANAKQIVPTRGPELVILLCLSPRTAATDAPEFRGNLVV